jgi:type IV pilus assembly protein PilA
MKPLNQEDHPMTPKFSPLSRQSDLRQARPTNGFTLMELLIVMAIIAILMLIAIPTVGSLKKRADDLSARQSIHAIQQAEIQYSDTYPANGYACTLPQADITSGYKSGYIFTITCKDKVTVNGVDRFNSYAITAVPQTVGKTGDVGYCSDQNGTIRFDPAGGTSCTQMLGQ